MPACSTAANTVVCVHQLGGKANAGGIGSALSGWGTGAAANMGGSKAAVSNVWSSTTVNQPCVNLRCCVHWLGSHCAMWGLFLSLRDRGWLCYWRMQVCTLVACGRVAVGLVSLYAAPRPQTWIPDPQTVLYCLRCGALRVLACVLWCLRAIVCVCVCRVCVARLVLAAVA